MPYRNNKALRLRPVNSIKHIVDIQAGIAGATNQDFTLIKAVDAPVATGASEVETSSVVRTFFLNVQVISTAETALNNTYFYIYKNPGLNISSANLPAGNAVGTSDFKNKVFHQEMVMLSDAADSIPITMFKGVIRIPRFMSRMGLRDEIRIRFFSPGAGNTQDACIQCIYKEFR